MKIEYENVSLMKACNTEVGQLMVITENIKTKDHIILHTYKGFVSLNDPSLTWDDGFSIEVILLPKGSKVTLIQE